MTTTALRFLYIAVTLQTLKRREAALWGYDNARREVPLKKSVVTTTAPRA
jgi:hypothetical protein